MTPVYKLTASSIKGRTNYGSMLAGNTAYVPPFDFESIATVTVGSGGAANVEFTSIGTDWTHLQIRLMVRSTTGGSNQDELRLQINSDTGSNYARHNLFANGSSVTASGNATQTFIYCGGAVRDGVTSGIYSVGVIDILDYRNTNKYKTLRSLNGDDQNGAGSLNFSSGLWMNTNAITSIKLYPEANNFKQYSHFALYGIKGA